MQAASAIMIAIGLLAVLGLVIGLFFHHTTKRKVILQSMPDSYRMILQRDVEFYQNIPQHRKKEFEDRMMHFLAHTKITGVRTTIEEGDMVYIAASAVIPIFGFPNWEYINLREVLLYPDSFNHEFEQQGAERNILGMVGDGPYSNVMILSRDSLREAFINKTGKSNTAIHEFVHLVDKSDGAVDGVPEYFADKKYILPWINMIHEEIEKIMKDRSDINPYGATNQAEFLAVVSEYFFERPDLLEEKNPELYKLLTQIFRQDPAKDFIRNTS